MFPDGAKEPYDRTRRIVQKLAVPLKALPNRVSITGHTAASRVPPRPGYGPWELSADRANAVRQILEDEGLPGAHIFDGRGQGRQPAAVPGRSTYRRQPPRHHHADARGAAAAGRLQAVVGTARITALVSAPQERMRRRLPFILCLALQARSSLPVFGEGGRPPGPAGWGFHGERRSPASCARQCPAGGQAVGSSALLAPARFSFSPPVAARGFIVDFVCLKQKLVVEVDGGQHNLDDHAARDRMRDRHFIRDGFRVLRFWNSDVDQNLTGAGNDRCGVAKQSARPQRRSPSSDIPAFRGGRGMSASTPRSCLSSAAAECRPSTLGSARSHPLRIGRIVAPMFRARPGVTSGSVL